MTSVVRVWKDTENTGYYDRHKFADATNGHPVGVTLGTWFTDEQLEKLKRELWCAGWEYCQKQYLAVGDPVFKGVSLQWRRDLDLADWRERQGGK